MDDIKTTIQFADGPEIPVDLSSKVGRTAAARVLKDALAKKFGRPSSQMDIADVDPDEQERRTKSADHVAGIAVDELMQFIERIERLEEEKSGIQADIKDVFAELKGRGYDAKAVKQILKMRKQDHSERQEQEAIQELYMQALGMA